MRLTSFEIARAAADAGFQPESLEKTLRLLELLEAIRAHPALRERVALKGGTALNLFLFDVPRLSIDIDLNYIGAADRNTMLTERPVVDEALQAVAGRLGLQTRRTPIDHAGGKWRLSYQAVSGLRATLELDTNYLLRSPLWPVIPRDSQIIAGFVARSIPLLDVNELCAGKLAALLARGAARDLFDAQQLLRKAPLDAAKLRLGFVVYGGMNRKDWRTVSVEDVRADDDEIDRMLIPLLRGHHAPTRRDLAAWSRALHNDCRDLLSLVLPLTAVERQFLTLLNDFGELQPALLTDDLAMQTLIRHHPGLLWKAKGATRRRGTPS